MTRTQRAGEGGFTLIELLVALGMTTVALAGLLGLFSTVMSGTQIAGQSGEATEIAEESLEELRGLPVPEIEALYQPLTGAGWGPVAHHGGAVVGRNGVVFHRRVSGASLSSSDDLVRLRIEVAWAESGASEADDEGLHEVRLEVVRARGAEL